MLQIMMGLQILLKYYPAQLIDIGHEQLWCCDDAYAKTLTPDDMAQLDSLGWFIDDEVDAWSHY